MWYTHHGTGGTYPGCEGILHSTVGGEAYTWVLASFLLLLVRFTLVLASFSPPFGEKYPGFSLFSSPRVGITLLSSLPGW